jgi:TldD protein
MDINIEKLEKLLEVGTYADIRINYGESNHIILKDGKIDEISSGAGKGVAVRVLYKNAWGFATSNDLNDIENLINKAYKMAKVSNEYTDKEVILKDVKAVVDKVKPKAKINPKDVDIDEKKEFVLLAYKNMFGDKVVSTSVSYSDAVGYSLFMSSEGTRIESERMRTIMYLTVVAKDGTLQYASERVGGSGFEVIKNANIENIAKSAKERAIRLLYAKSCPKGKFKVILDPELTGVFIHEAVGHASEADLVLQNDSVFKDKIGEKVGSEYVTVIDSPEVEGFGSYKYDDEGVEGRETIIIENGILKNFLHTRETAGRLNMEVTGNARAEGLNKPIVRMSNTFIKPGDWDFEELLEDTKDGIFLKGSRGGQVDTGKGLFQFSAVEAFLIENGELTTPLKDAGLSGEILSILYNVDAVTKEFKLSVGYCGKNGQSVPVGDGGGSIRTIAILS